MSFLSVHTPIGDLSLAEENNVIVSLDWGWGSVQEPSSLLKEAKDQLRAYFLGTLKQFDLLLQPKGTAYQQKIWQHLLTIPYGQTQSYKTLDQ